MASPDKGDKELVGILISELDHLAEEKAHGRQHPKEDQLQGNLSEIRYLRLYRMGRSTRMYFTVMSNVIWMLALHANKRKESLTDGMKRSLAGRLNEAKIEAAR